MDARLDTGGWLALTRQGLSPCKRRQACLGARTLGVRRGWKLKRSGSWQPSPARPCWARARVPGRAVPSPITPPWTTPPRVGSPAPAGYPRRTPGPESAGHHLGGPGWPPRSPSAPTVSAHRPASASARRALSQRSRSPARGAPPARGQPGPSGTACRTAGSPLAPAQRRPASGGAPRLGAMPSQGKGRFLALGGTTWFFLLHPGCPTLALTCRRKPERGTSEGWRRSGAALGSVRPDDRSQPWVSPVPTTSRGGRAASGGGIP